MTAGTTIPPVPTFAFTLKQPNRADVLISDEEALLSKEAYNMLQEYSRTLPTFKCAGRMWKAVIDGESYLRWFSEIDHKNQIHVLQRKIRIFDWRALMGDVK